ncbi:MULTISPECIES: serine hydrolase domain-containing protein [Paenibacillus]|uniref:serine hydrolase domain-containing protein n=1 Tax=Paenibacillus TaxID=44249 RepID=UPI0022B8A76D|nr:serine hydrolase domain-containing protein [Paenibacillus caseinilyticus]MCZ8517849.1 serine hydrolase [Paenibacillus caseinilyticus]
MTTAKNKFILCLSSVLLWMSIQVHPVSAIEVPNKAEGVRQEIDNYIKNNMEANNIKAASLAIVNKEEVFYTNGYGEFPDGRQIIGSTPFPIASLSKAFTALAVLQLVEKGRIHLDTPYAVYFPELSPKDERVRTITVRNLLNQTTGLNDKVNPDMTRSPQYQSLREINQSLSTVQLANDPGTAYIYHNPNYQYLALLVEKVSGQDFSAYMKKNIFEHLGMRHTFSISTTQQINENPAIPRGNYLLLGLPVRQEEPHWFIDGPAGIVSTAEDMAKWMLAQYHGELLTSELMEEYHTAGQNGPYGMGWNVDEDEHRGRTLSHNGIFWTYKSEEKIDLDHRLGITMMFNSGINTFVDYGAFVEGIERIIKGEKAEAPIFNSKKMETVMILLIIATGLWGLYTHFRISKSNKGITAGQLIFSSVWWILPGLILVLLSPLTTFMAAGRVVPWLGLWTTMSSLIIWLVVITLVNITNWVCQMRRFCQVKLVQSNVG